jgi:(1->4)-alpha-D-glucan 1-alpha-D-glucosylmutase
VTASGEAAEHVLAFARGGVLSVVTRLPVGLAARGWGGTSLPLPEGSWGDVLTGREHSGQALLHELLAEYPVALLVREEG